MNTRELIKALQEADPEGTAPVVVDNKEVYFVEHIEAYWDGRAQLHIVDEALKPYWHIVGMKVTSKGSKVRINTIGVEDFIDSFPDGPVDLSELGNPSWRQEWESLIAKWREQIKRIKAEVAKKYPETDAK